MSRLRLLDRLLDLLLGAPCAVTWERVYPRDRAAHEADEHPGEGACDA